ncbi:acyl-CoA dehydrogenase [Lysobacter enzymogenes]|uniref:Acyl-[acyl-carrier-protein] dehydrogenase MbtN n=1 Tax=Lysobacter enzymogenes TaxID=69 RepID=A0A0S2DFD2_LYSEN|nr:acyl-CoA dehydrogenase family protein [Lysobacter enzymogenes]ALN57202.1 acyl-CoA dehydrogenase [Lysobacter enzymogenes]
MTLQMESAFSDIAAFKDHLDAILARESTRRLVEDAEAAGLFPRGIVELLGREGIFAAKWQERPVPALEHTLALSERFGRLGAGGIASAVTLHDSAIAMLRRFGRSQALRDVADQAIAGRAVLCISATEAGAGSDMLGLSSTAVREEGGYRLRGHKKMASPSPVADYIVLALRGIDESHAGRDDLALFLVPTSQLRVGKAFETVGARSISTAPVFFDTWVPAEMMIARPGTGLAVLSWALAQERFAMAAQILGACHLALGVTVARMKRRKTFGVALFDHQALRLRIADLQARVDMMRLALNGLIANAAGFNVRSCSAAKVTAVRLGCEVMSECMHIFGSAGVLETESPLGRWWRDVKMARIGGGTDEMLWEIVAAGLEPDYASYDQMVNEWQPEPLG